MGSSDQGRATGIVPIDMQGEGQWRYSHPGGRRDRTFVWPPPPGCLHLQAQVCGGCSWGRGRSWEMHQLALEGWKPCRKRRTDITTLSGVQGQGSWGGGSNRGSRPRPVKGRTPRVSEWELTMRGGDTVPSPALGPQHLWAGSSCPWIDGDCDPTSPVCPCALGEQW